ncbi:MAG: FtsX-like permease family protein [Gemmatimonadetes bacterium]|nr:FtsX-like permease family protein [Gemmatimonadota bacterium]
MLKNHFVIALRHLFANKGYFFINTMGLSIGIASCLLIFLFVRHEWTYDAFHEKSDRLYRVVAAGFGAADNPYTTAATPLPLASALKQQYPDVVRTVRILDRELEIRIGEDQYRKEEALFCDASFLDMFSFPMIEGDRSTALNDVNSVVISRFAAEKYYGGDSPLGRQLLAGGALLTVAGVMENAPANSSIQFDMLIPFDKAPEIYPWISNAIGRWNYSSTETYIELSDPLHAALLEDQLPDFVKTHYPAYMSPQLIPQPITAMYLDQEVRFGQGPTSDPNLSYILICTALLVLFIACVNFMNLAVCRSSSRAKEVGLRKVFGAKQTEVMGQYMGETAVQCGFALVLGIVLAHLFLPVFNMLAGRTLELDYLSSGSTIAALLVLTGLVALVSGSYPSLVLSRFNPVAIFRRQVQIGGPNLFVQSLMVVQFGLSALLVISILVMTRQLDFVRTGDVGFNPENVVVIQTGPGSGYYDVYRNRIASYEEVLQVSGTSHTFGEGRGLGQSAYTDRDGNQLEAYMFTVDYDYVNTLQLQLVSGRDFSREFGGDETASCLINEAAAREMEWEDPVGRKLPHGYTVIGVVRDYNFQSKHEEIEPAILSLAPTAMGEISKQFQFVLVRISSGDTSATLSLLGDAWRETMPETPFEYFFLEDDIARFYQDEQNLARIFSYSAAFALLIACLGVYGLVSLDAARRTREVGIRKVMGAAAGDIVSLLSRQFVVLVVIGNVLAWPAAWWLMNAWLADFAFRTEIGAVPFVAAGLAVMATAMLTVSAHAFRSAMLDPADALRRE